MANTMTQDSIDKTIEKLIDLDPRLEQIKQTAGEVKPRSRPAGFTGLARIVCGQQLSVASADAIWRRVEEINASQSPQSFLNTEHETLRNTGLSNTKIATISLAANAIINNELDLENISNLSAEQACATLTQYKGIGPWTAEVYLLFCAAHPDIFPVGDLALRKAVAHAFGIAEGYKPKDILAESLKWQPYRSVAALLFWRYYAAIRNTTGIPI